MVKSVHLSSEIESRLSVISRQVSLGEDELITEAIMNYLEDFEDIQEAQVRLSTPPDRYLYSFYQNMEKI